MIIHKEKYVHWQQEEYPEIYPRSMRIVSEEPQERLIFFSVQHLHELIHHYTGSQSPHPGAQRRLSSEFERSFLITTPWIHYTLYQHDSHDRWRLSRVFFSPCSLEEDNLASYAMLPNDYQTHACQGFREPTIGFLPGKLITEFWQGYFNFDGLLSTATHLWLGEDEELKHNHLRKNYPAWEKLLQTSRYQERDIERRTDISYVNLNNILSSINTCDAYLAGLERWEELSEQEVINLPWPQNVDPTEDHVQSGEPTDTPPGA